MECHSWKEMTMSAPRVTTTRLTGRMAADPTVAETGTEDWASANGPAFQAQGTALAATGLPIDPALVRGMIAEAAYYRAEKRGFAAGGAEQDWLEAESLVKATLGL
jgi:hypothetical protein